MNDVQDGIQNKGDWLDAGFLLMKCRRLLCLILGF